MRVSEDLGTVTDLIGRGVLKPVIDRVVPLEEASRAHAVLESDEFFGKVVLRVAS
jgi:NADPH:quinone reductase-like Zn-dependent oxidoreductase